MAMAWLWTGMVAVSLIFGALTGNLNALSAAALEGAQSAVELCLLVVLNTASIQLLPTTLAGVRASLGAADPFDILPAVWLTSLLSVLAGLLAAKLFAHFWRN